MKTLQESTFRDTVKSRFIYKNPFFAGDIDVSVGVRSQAQNITPNSNGNVASSIEFGRTAASVGTVTTDATDFIVLPPIADLPIGHTITIGCNAGGNFEMRTPDASGTAINNVDSDGTNEYLCTDTDTIRIWKLSTSAGWVAQSLTNLGAVRAAVVPD